MFRFMKECIKKELSIIEREINTDKLQDEKLVLIIDEISRGNVFLQGASNPFF